MWTELIIILGTAVSLISTLMSLGGNGVSDTMRLGISGIYIGGIMVGTGLGLSIKEVIREG